MDRVPRQIVLAVGGCAITPNAYACMLYVPEWKGLYIPIVIILISIAILTLLFRLCYESAGVSSKFYAVLVLGVSTWFIFWNYTRLMEAGFFCSVDLFRPSVVLLLFSIATFSVAKLYFLLQGR